MILSGWGQYPKIDANLNAPRTFQDLKSTVLQSNCIARGNGRAYGDSAINSQNTIHMKNFNRILSFDNKNGQLVVEAGVMLSDVIKVFLPQGWFTYVTPGSKFVTIGGMIAADVHGKNHHKDGSFGKYVDWIDLIVSDGTVCRCSKTENTKLFEWTIGGMGLTGIIIRAAFKLRPINSAWIQQRTLIAKNITQAMQLLEQSLDTTYSAAWIDCLQKGNSLGRSLVMLGEHANVNRIPLKYQNNPLQIPKKKKINITFNLPNLILNKFSARTFNAFYYWNGRLQDENKLVDLESYFYPLDSIIGWNKIYGRRGFAQFQCVIPLSNSKKGLSELLEATSKAGVGSFLAVLKRFGNQSSRFSFPMEGYTLALDYPINKKTLALMNELDSITLKHKGRCYLAKDSRMSRNVFSQSDPRSGFYKNYRKVYGLDVNFSSSQSERLGL